MSDEMDEGSSEPEQRVSARFLFEGYTDILRGLANLYERHPARRREVTIEACKATVRFLLLMGKTPQHMIIFTSLQEALKDVDEGITPPLFRQDQQPTKKDRSREQEFHRMWAAALLNVLMKLGEPEKPTAARIARYANRWPNFETVPITTTTISNWRTGWLGREPEARQQFDCISKDLANDSNRAEIEIYIRGGPPGFQR